MHACLYAPNAVRRTSGEPPTLLTLVSSVQSYDLKPTLLPTGQMTEAKQTKRKNCPASPFLSQKLHCTCSRTAFQDNSRCITSRDVSFCNLGDPILIVVTQIRRSEGPSILRVATGA